MSVEPESLNRDEILEKLSALNREYVLISQELGRKNRQLKSAQARIQVLEGKIPICMHCKSIRDENNEWHDLEAFLTERTNIWFTHSICPDCMSNRYGFMTPG